MVKLQVEHRAVERRSFKDKLDQEKDQTLPVVSILFDESHEELLRSQTDGEQEQEVVDTWEQLRQELVGLGYRVAVPLDREGELTSEILQDHNVLVLAAPRRPLSSSEVKAVTHFVEQGNSLLVANNYESLWQQQKANKSDSINTLLRAFGLQIKQLLSYPPEEVATFHPHYLSSEINRLFVKEPAYLEILPDLPEGLLNRPHTVASLPWTDQTFLAVSEIGYGRVVAISDFVIFGDDYIRYGDNRQLVKNIFRWLTFQNSLDCFNAHCKDEVQQGQTFIFSIELHNPHSKRIEHISCLLESDARSAIEEPLKKIRSLAPYGRTRVQWIVEPKQLGFQTLKLTIDLPPELEHSSLFFDSAAQFKCVPDFEIDLVILNQKEEVPESVETGNPFEVQAVFRQKTDIKPTSLQLHLEYPFSHLRLDAVEQNGVNRWRMTALEAGDWPITLVVGETGQRISRLIRVRSSIQDQIAAIERDIVAPLAAQINCKVSQLASEFGTEAISAIPFRLVTPDEQVRLLNPPNIAQELLEALQVARIETRQNRPLVALLLLNIAPTYSPKHGCVIPYEPKLAAHLTKEHASSEESLAQNFLSLEGYNQTWLEQNIAALILHEKYGHGFFFTQTKLGRQLAILYNHGLTRDADPKRLPSPYPRMLYDEYHDAIQALWDSVLLVNEGFAAWMELAVLPRLGDVIGQAAYRRKDFLFNRDEKLFSLSQRSQYFKRFQPSYDSRYKEGCEYLQQIQGYFGGDFGFKCAVQAVIKAADIDAGITESNGRVQFALDAARLKKALLEDEEDDARADMRLKRINEVLRESCNYPKADKNSLLYDDNCSNLEYSVGAVISEKLGW